MKEGARQAAQAIVGVPKGLAFRMGTVTAFNAGPPRVVTATIGGVSVPQIPVLDHCAVSSGAAMWFIKTGKGKLLGVGSVDADEFSFPRLRLTSTADLSLLSDTHAFQIGADGGLNIGIDINEVGARNNGAASQLNLNVDGGLVKAGTGGLGANWTSVTSGAVAGTDWTVLDLDAWVAGHFMMFRLVVDYTGSGLGGFSSTTGNVTNEVVATLPSSLRGGINTNLNCNGAGSTGRMAGGTFNPSTGDVSVTSIAGTSNLANGEDLTFGGMFIINST